MTLRWSPGRLVSAVTRSRAVSAGRRGAGGLLRRAAPRAGARSRPVIDALTGAALRREVDRRVRPAALLLPALAVMVVLWLLLDPSRIVPAVASPALGWRAATVTAAADGVRWLALASFLDGLLLVGGVSAALAQTPPYQRRRDEVLDLWVHAFLHALVLRRYRWPDVGAGARRRGEDDGQPDGEGAGEGATVET